MVDRALLRLTVRHDLLGAVWALVSWLQVSGVHDGLLGARQHLRSRVRGVGTRYRATEASLVIVVHLLLRLHISHVLLVKIIVLLLVVDHLVLIVEHLGALVVTLQYHGAAGPFFVVQSTVLLLLTQCDAALSEFVRVDLAALGPAVGVQGAGTAADLVVRVVLEAHCVSTHCLVGLGLHVVPLELLKLLLLILLLEGGARARMLPRGDGVLGTGRALLGFLSFEVVVRQITDIVLILFVLLMFALNVLSGDDIVRILYETLASSVGIGSVLGGRPSILLIRLSLDILGQRRVLAALHHAAGARVLEGVPGVLLVGVLTR